MKSIILCADDYGQNREVSQGIVELIAQQRLSATSCLVTSPHWREQAQWLKPYLHSADVGLHFNLTEGEGLPSLKALLLRSHCGLVSVAAVKQELLRQLDAFEQEMGCLPVFIDGHQHVHQFPRVRQALLQVYQEHLRGTKIYIRCTAHLPGERGFKPWMIRHTGALNLERQLQRHNIPHNRSFAGIYSFQNPERYPSLFKHFLQHITDRGLIMCHPGLESADNKDPLQRSRAFEYRYFASESFLQDLRETGVKVGRMTEEQ